MFVNAMTVYITESSMRVGSRSALVALVKQPPKKVLVATVLLLSFILITGPQGCQQCGLLKLEQSHFYEISMATAGIYAQ